MNYRAPMLINPIREDCDFCNQKPAIHTWRTPHETELPPMRSATPGVFVNQSTDPEWVCCEVCNRLIAQGKWEEVEKRAVEAYVAGRKMSYSKLVYYKDLIHQTYERIKHVLTYVGNNLMPEIRGMEGQTRTSFARISKKEK